MPALRSAAEQIRKACKVAVRVDAAWRQSGTPTRYKTPLLSLDM